MFVYLKTLNTPMSIYLFSVTYMSLNWWKNELGLFYDYILMNQGG